MKLKVIVDIGYKVFVDIDYQLSVNTLGEKKFLLSQKITCNDDMSKSLDETLYENANAELESKYGCKYWFA